MLKAASSQGPASPLSSGPVPVQYLQKTKENFLFLIVEVPHSKARPVRGFPACFLCPC